MPASDAKRRYKHSTLWLLVRARRVADGGHGYPCSALGGDRRHVQVIVRCVPLGSTCSLQANRRMPPMEAIGERHSP